MKGIRRITMLFVIISKGLIAQQAIVTSGYDISSSSGSVSYTIGQVVNQSLDNGTFFETQGIQQPYEILTYLIDIEMDASLSSLRLYPNPTTSNIMIGIETIPSGNLRYELIDALQRVIHRGSITENLTSIDVEKYASGIFLLRILSDSKVKQVFKIIKNNSQ